MAIGIALILQARYRDIGWIVVSCLGTIALAHAFPAIGIVQASPFATALTIGLATNLSPSSRSDALHRVRVSRACDRGRSFIRARACGRKFSSSSGKYGSRFEPDVAHLSRPATDRAPRVFRNGVNSCDHFCRAFWASLLRMPSQRQPSRRPREARRLHRLPRCKSEASP